VFASESLDLYFLDISCNNYPTLRRNSIPMITLLKYPGDPRLQLPLLLPPLLPAPRVPPLLSSSPVLPSFLELSRSCRPRPVLSASSHALKALLPPVESEHGRSCPSSAPPSAALHVPRLALGKHHARSTASFTLQYTSPPQFRSVCCKRSSFHILRAPRPQPACRMAASAVDSSTLYLGQPDVLARAYCTAGNYSLN
jgi:hypothetical protein